MKFSRLFAVACAAVFVVAAAPALADPPTVADFVGRAALSNASLSPTGRYLVWAVHEGDNTTIHIRDLEENTVFAMGAGSARENLGGVYVDWIEWKSDDRLLIGMTRIELRRQGGRENGRVHGYSYGQSVISTNRDGSSFVPLAAPGTKEALPGQLLDTLTDDPEHILMSYRDPNGGLSVAKVNVLTGEAEKTIDGHRRVIDYITDRDGRVMGRTAYRGEGRILLMEALEADGRWTEVFRLRRDDVRNLPDYDFIGPTDEPGKAYVTVQPDAPDGQNTAAIHVFDFATRTMGPAIWSHPQYDAAGIVVDEETSELLAGCYWADTYRCDYKQRGQDAVMTGIRRFFGDGWSVRVISQARDNSRWLVRASAPNNPGQFYIFNVADRHMEFVGSIYPRLPETALGEMARVDYTATDGQALFGYLTRPPGAAPDARLPLVVLPHGGPEARDYLTYDRWAQFLATRGYQVFQPNFRGSAGMGKAFADAGRRHWGERMQDDITDGIDHLVTQGLADRGQVCIMGASYGGYAALQGGAAQPDLYRCVISIAGPSDLMGMLQYERLEAGADSDTYEYWVRSIGDPRADRARIEAVSPLRRAADWRPPVLLIHGDKDEVVPPEQSRNMDQALRRAGKEVRLVILDDARHSGWSTSQHSIILNEIESFLGQHLPVAPAVMAEAGATTGANP